MSESGREPPLESETEPMQALLRQRVLKHLAALSVAASCGMIDPSSSLLEIPAELVTDIVAETEELGWSSEDRARMLHLLTSDPRALVRARVAEAAPNLWLGSPVAAEHLVRDLAKDRSPKVRRAAGQGLAAILERASSIERVELVCQWTVSTNAWERAAVARALDSLTPVLVTDLAIEQLASDSTAVCSPRRLAALRRKSSILRARRSGACLGLEPKRAAHGAAASRPRRFDQRVMVIKVADRSVF
jgi:hypothetical protein